LGAYHHGSASDKYKLCSHSNCILAICPKNKPFYAETLKAGKAAAAPPKNQIGVADALIYLLWTQVSPTII
jgi:hypothetical protein